MKLTTICTVTNLHFPPLTSPSTKMTLISRQVSRVAQTVTTKYHSLVTALPLYDCMDTASMLLSSLYHHRVGEGGREGGGEGLSIIST